MSSSLGSPARTRRQASVPPLTHAELLSHVDGEPYRLIRRFAIEQSTGKWRALDDAAAGGQSLLSSDANKLRLPSAMQPAVHLSLLFRSMQEDEGFFPPDDGISSGGEDWPCAYRFTPMRPEDALACVVVYWHPEWLQPAFHIYSGFLFGFPLAVTSFNRWSKFAEAIVRRTLFLLFSMYFDDGTLQAFTSAAADSQAALSHVMYVLGSPWAP